MKFKDIAFSSGLDFEELCKKFDAADTYDTYKKVFGEFSVMNFLETPGVQFLCIFILLQKVKELEGRLHDQEFKL